MISWPNELVLDIARRRSVLFIGAGISKSSVNDMGERPKDWLEFLHYLASKVEDEQIRKVITLCIDRGDLLTACEITRKAIHTDIFIKELYSCFSEKRFRFAKIHEDLVEIDSRIVLTTNFDKLYENSANSILHGDVIVKSYVEDGIGDLLRRQNRCILKIHGTIDSPGSVILTRKDYAAARNVYAGFYRLVDALFITHTFVFLGASMKDPDIALLLEDYALRHKDARPHYVVMPSGNTSAAEISVMEETMNLRVILYSNKDNHAELAEGVSLLKSAVSETRALLLQTMNW